jgi:hypothetical protein
MAAGALVNQIVSTGRTHDVISLYQLLALRAGPGQGPPQQEIENETNGVGNKDNRRDLQRSVHLPPPRVEIDINDRRH